MERGFSAGTLFALCCTSTLAAGINLPARRCVIRHGAGKLAVSRAQYLQMVGRAGRAGKCPVGEAFLVCDWDGRGDARKNGAPVAAARKLLAAPMPRLRSNLVPRGWAAAGPEQRKYARTLAVQLYDTDVVMLSPIARRIDIIKLLNWLHTRTHCRTAYTSDVLQERAAFQDVATGDLGADEEAGAGEHDAASAQCARPRGSPLAHPRVC